MSWPPQRPKWDSSSQWSAREKNNLFVDNGIVQFSGVPDADDLLAHYDFSEEDGTTPVTDKSGNGHDLDGSYSGVSVDINGMQAGEFRTDLLQTTFSAVGQPTTIFIVFEEIANNSGNATIFDGGTQLEQAFFDDTQDSGYELYAGSRIGGTYDVNVGDAEVMAGLFDGANSSLRFDGVENVSGDPGANSLSGISLGGQADNTAHSDVKIGEVLVYPMDKSAIFTDVENYLIDKWGPV